jgi:hypothetical protein
MAAMLIPARLLSHIVDLPIDQLPFVGAGDLSSSQKNSLIRPNKRREQLRTWHPRRQSLRLTRCSNISRQSVIQSSARPHFFGAKKGAPKARWRVLPGPPLRLAQWHGFLLCPPRKGHHWQESCQSGRWKPRSCRGSCPAPHGPRACGP